MDRAVGLLPAIAVVEVEARRQRVAADRGEGLLLHHDHPGAEFGPPDMGIQEAHRACGEARRVHHEGRHDEHQMARGHDIVVHHAERLLRQGVERGQPALRVDPVEEQQRPRRDGAADVPHRAVRLHLGMGREGRAREVRAPGDEVAGGQRLGIDRERRAPFPERHEATAVGEHGGVGGVHVVGRHDRCGLGRQGGEGGQDAPARLRLAAALGRLQDAGAVAHAAPGKGEGLHHAVAVEPVAVAVAEALVLGRAVAPEHARESGRQAAGERRQRRRELFRRRRGEAEPALLRRERRGATGRIPARRPHAAGRQQDRQAAQRLQQRAAGECVRHRSDSCPWVSA